MRDQLQHTAARNTFAIAETAAIRATQPRGRIALATSGAHGYSHLVKASTTLHLVDPFLVATREEDSSLAAALDRLDDLGRRELAGILGRFGGSGRHELHAIDRLLARRLLKPLRHHDVEMLSLLNKVLDYLDLDANARLDEQELERCIESIESFARLTPPATILSRPELEKLHAVLRALDANDDHMLDADERRAFFEHVRDPELLVARLEDGSLRRR